MLSRCWCIVVSGYRVRSLSGTVMWLRLDAFATNDKTMGDDINRRLGVIHSVFFSALAVRVLAYFGACSNRWCFGRLWWEIPVSYTYVYVYIVLEYIEATLLMFLDMEYGFATCELCSVCDDRDYFHG